MLRFAGQNAFAQIIEATKTPGSLSTRDLVCGVCLSVSYFFVVAL